ncbi:MAG: molybdopterin-dependent oxidoreductase, partial [Firmicutes bacterium]|nr:molybdopterin-dependent oxidoreductase [Bacillota bacterium]
GFEESDFIIEEEFVTPFGDHAYLETECGIAKVDEEGNIIVWASTQSPYRDQMEIAHAMGVPPGKVRVVAPYLGGGFGKKDGITVQIYLALLALRTGKPVKMQSSREESISCYYKRHATVFKLKLGFKKDGTLMALKSKIVYDTGAYASFGEKVLGGGVEYGTGPYKIENIGIDGFSVYTNQAPAGAFRGFGMPQACFAMELIMDMSAEKLGMDPIEFRLKNAVKQGEEAALGHIMEYSTGAKETLEILKESDIWREREKFKDDLPAGQKQWKRRGVGIACSFKGCGLAIGIPDFSSAKIEIKEDGKFILRVGNTEMGQGSQWTYTLIAAETLGCSTDDITTVLPDTFTNPSGGSTSASRSTILGGNATCQACRQLKEIMSEAVSVQLKEAKEDIEFSKGKISVKNKPDKFLSFGEAASILYNERKPVSAVSKVDMPLAGKQDIGYGLPHIIYGYAAHLALVEVDTVTGEVEVLKIVSAIDCGKPIYIHGVEGQSEGGTAMGVGYALMENQLYEQGRVLNSNYSTYIIPTALDMPEIETRIVDTYEEQGPFGAKGIGECVTGPTAPAVLNAVRDAIGIRFKRIPVLPEMVMEALSSKNRKG